jgi:hypothetical protein
MREATVTASPQTSSKNLRVPITLATTGPLPMPIRIGTARLRFTQVGRGGAHVERQSGAVSLARAASHEAWTTIVSRNTQQATRVAIKWPNCVAGDGSLMS